MGIAAAIGVGAVVGGGASLLGSSKQAGAAKAGQASQERMFQLTQQQLAPFRQFGMGTGTMLTGLLGEGGALSSANYNPLPMAGNFDPRMLAGTPGYQFAMGEGLRAMQNGATAKGLGLSGPAMKGAGRFAAGLAENTYGAERGFFGQDREYGFNFNQQNFANSELLKQNLFERLFGVTGLGANAAAGVGNAATATGQGIAASQMNAGNAAAGGMVGAGNALSGGLNNFAQMQWLQKMQAMNPTQPFFAPPNSAVNMNALPLAA